MFATSEGKFEHKHTVARGRLTLVVDEKLSFLTEHLRTDDVDLNDVRHGRVDEL